MTPGLADGAVFQAAVAILDVIRANTVDEPLAAVDRGTVPFSLPCQLLLGQSTFRRLLVFSAPNSLAVFIENGHPLLGSRHRVVPAIRLLPVPSRSMRLPPNFSFSPHETHSLLRLAAYLAKIDLPIHATDTVGSRFRLEPQTVSILRRF